MRTDRVQVALRRREGFEAIDLGFRLARATAGSVLKSWLGLVVPVAVLILFALRAHPFWTLFVLWWLRPVFGRVALHVQSRAVFDEPTGFLGTLRALPELARSGILTSLFLQRLSPARSFLLPVLQLEGLRGAARRERCVVLARRDLGASAALLSAAAHFNAALVLGGLLLAQMLLPEEITWDVWELFLPLVDEDVARPGWVLLPGLYFVGVSLVEPLVVAGGFGLYLNRRVDLEGWDIDLAFRNLARRVSGAGRASRAAGVAATLLLVIAPLAPLRAEVCDPGSPASARPCIESVLADPDFGTVREETRWSLRDFARAEPSSDPWLPSWLGDALAVVIEIALWAGLAGLVAAVLVAVARRIERTPAEPSTSSGVTSLFGLDLDPRSLPDDLVAAARAAFARGAAVEALSLLYRGALVRLTEGDGLEIPQSATELECVRLARRAHSPDRTRVFDELTRLWLAARYADEPPSGDRFEALCRRFEPAFAEAAP